MSLKIEEIREKFERLTSHIAWFSEEMRRQSDRADKAWAEVDKLRAELDRTRKQLNAAVTLLAEWSHAVDNGGSSWDYWDNHYKEARWGKGILRSLIDAEIAKLEGEP